MIALERLLHHFLESQFCEVVELVAFFLELFAQLTVEFVGDSFLVISEAHLDFNVAVGECAVDGDYGEST